VIKGRLRPRRGGKGRRAVGRRPRADARRLREAQSFLARVWDSLTQRGRAAALLVRILMGCLKEQRALLTRKARDEAAHIRTASARAASARLCTAHALHRDSSLRQLFARRAAPHTSHLDSSSRDGEGPKALSKISLAVAGE